jgi:hypothetical protein
VPQNAGIVNQKLERAYRKLAAIASIKNCRDENARPIGNVNNGSLVFSKLVSQLVSKLVSNSSLHLLGKLGSFLISRICWMCLSACVEISSIHCQQSITSP